MGKSLIVFSLLMTGYHLVESRPIKREIDVGLGIKCGIAAGMGAGVGAAVGFGLGAVVGAVMETLGYEVPSGGPKLDSLMSMFSEAFE